MLLTTFSGPPASRAARSPACCASIGLDTEPDSITPSPTPSIWMSEFGNVCFSAARTPLRSRVDGDVVGGDLLTGGIEEHDIGLTDRRADNIGALRRADDRGRNLGIGDQHILDITRQIDHDGFADAEREKARIHLSVGDNRRGGAIVARHHRGQDRVERERRDR